MDIQKKLYGTLQDGTAVHSFTLHNAGGMKAVILEYGAIVAELEVPDKNKAMRDVVLGYDHLDKYQKDVSYFGATVGRVANRMGGAKFSLDGETYKVAANALPDFGNNHLHGGVKGFNKALWTGCEFNRESEAGVRLEYLSRDGEEGYPGNLKCIVEYTLTEDNALCIKYEAVTDKTTLVNLTHHSYFNLSGAGCGNVLEHRIQINSKRYTPADEDLIPRGEILSVLGLPVDFTRERTIGSRFSEMLMSKFKGYDLNYILNHQNEGSLELAATVRDISSGITMDVHTTQPCMHFYTSNFLDGIHGKNGLPYHQNGALCLEPQGFPDAPNHENFLPVVLKPGELYKQTICFSFSISEQNQ